MRYFSSLDVNELYAFPHLSARNISSSGVCFVLCRGKWWNFLHGDDSEGDTVELAESLNDFLLNESQFGSNALSRSYQGFLKTSGNHACSYLLQRWEARQRVRRLMQITPERKRLLVTNIFSLWKFGAKYIYTFDLWVFGE